MYLFFHTLHSHFPTGYSRGLAIFLLNLECSFIHLALVSTLRYRNSLLKLHYGSLVSVLRFTWICKCYIFVFTKIYALTYFIHCFILRFISKSTVRKEDNNPCLLNLWWLLYGGIKLRSTSLYTFPQSFFLSFFKKKNHQTNLFLVQSELEENSWERNH